MSHSANHSDTLVCVGCGLKVFGGEHLLDSNGHKHVFTKWPYSNDLYCEDCWERTGSKKPPAALPQDVIVERLAFRKNDRKDAPVLAHA